MEGIRYYAKFIVRHRDRKRLELLFNAKWIEGDSRLRNTGVILMAQQAIYSEQNRNNNGSCTRNTLSYGNPFLRTLARYILRFVCVFH